MFFDFLGLVLVHYSEWVGIMLNLLVVVISVLKSIQKARNSYRYIPWHSVCPINFRNLYPEWVGILLNLIVVGVSAYEFRRP